jgi:UDP-N-acetylmuramyl pentapeptide phosphotransferase/UDP-N-acetylglucosamine-1-phosphate transferase
MGLDSGLSDTLLASAGVAVTIVTLALAVSAGLIVLMRPLFRRYALARPNARSSHREPTPQGGGIAVIGATLMVAAAAGLGLQHFTSSTLWNFGAIAFATTLLAAVGAIDDIRPLPASWRLIAQAVAVIAMLSALPYELRILPFAPRWLEWTLLAIGGVWFVNLVNFMDGIDWMTVCEVVPGMVALVLIGSLAGIPSFAIVIALALLGAILGFAPFNRPVARLFLGDAGSLPIGLIFGWLLALVAARGYLAAAVLVPLYYLADTAITIFRRLVAGEHIMTAHRTHFYQRAIDCGYSVNQIVARVLALNIALGLLALVTVAFPSLAMDLAAVTLGAGAVAGLLFAFVKGEQKK